MCKSCSASFVQWGNIKGIVHESGCPEAHKDMKHECKYCGCKFQPEEKSQIFCSRCCAASYNGFSCDCESCRSLYRETDYSDENNDGFLLEETEED